MGNFTTKYFKDTNCIECYYKDELQGRIVIDLESDVSINLGILEYVGRKTGKLTLRSAIPESKLSDYNIAKCLFDEVKNRGLLDSKYYYKLTPEAFGYKSYRAMIAESEYIHMTKDELIDKIVELTLTLEAAEKAGW